LKKKRETQLLECQLCHQRKPGTAMFPADMVRDSVVATIQAAHPDWNPDGYICSDDLNHFRTEHVEDLLEAEKGELDELEAGVIKALRKGDVVASNVAEEFEEQATFGQRVADKVAEFGGSWAFMGSFGAVLALWIALNSIHLLHKPFDPFPYILLNLCLSCLASIQAPVIMMSQNRQEARDRLRSENDYQINLKAELEIRAIDAKMDQLLTHQWQHLLEIQQIQTEMVEEMTRHIRGDQNGLQAR